MIENINLKKVTQKNEDEIIESVNRVIKSGWYLQGVENKNFEKNYAQFIIYWMFSFFYLNMKVLDFHH